MSEILIAAFRAQVADLQLARKHSGEMVNMLMQTKMDEAGRQKLFEKIVEHMVQQDAQRSDQYRAVIRSTLLGLNSMAQSTSDQRLKQHLIEMIKALNIVVETK